MPANAMDDMTNSLSASQSILEDMYSKKDEFMRSVKQSALDAISVYRAELNDIEASSLDSIRKLRKEEKALNDEWKKANGDRKKELEEQMALKQQAIEQEEEALRKQEETYAKQIEQQRIKIDLREQEYKKAQKIEEAEKARVQRERQSKMAGSRISSATNIAQGLGTSGVRASQIDTKGYNEAIAFQNEQVELAKQQLATADEGNKAAAAEYLKEQERHLEQLEQQKSMIDAVNSVNETFVKEVNKAVKVLEDNELKANTRLMGSTKSFTSIMKLTNSMLAASPFVKTENVIRDIASGISQGIVTNVEMRGFLNSIKEGIVSTFDAFDEKINRLIRIQQQDSTAARMGMEASLMKLYNQMFETSEYLQNGFDSVTSAIYDASSIIGAAQAEEMEFVMQKWLGSLYSVGMSQEAVTSIASAINQLASGDVSGVGSGAQNLITMAMSRVGMSLDQMLTGGIGAQDLNSIMESVVLYLQDIAESSQNNNVVQKELGRVFGVNISDIKAATNLTAQDISTLAGYAQSYGDAQKELNSQLGTMYQRMSESVWLSNIYDNFMLASGMTVAENPVTYFMQKILGVLPDMEIPMPQAMGWGLSSGLPLKDLLQTALTGFGLLGGAVNAISSIGNLGGLNLAGWNPKERVQRGTATINVSSGFTQQTSASQYASSGSSEDMKASAMGMGASESEQGGKTVGTGKEGDTYDATDIYKLLVAEDTKILAPVEVRNDEWNSLLNAGVVIQGAMEATLTSILAELGVIIVNTAGLGGLSALFGGGNTNAIGGNGDVTIKSIDTALLENLSDVLAMKFADSLTMINEDTPIPTKVVAINGASEDMGFDLSPITKFGSGRTLAP